MRRNGRYGICVEVHNGMRARDDKRENYAMDHDGSIRASGVRDEASGIEVTMKPSLGIGLLQRARMARDFDSDALGGDWCGAVRERP